MSISLFLENWPVKIEGNPCPLVISTIFGCPRFFYFEVRRCPFELGTVRARKRQWTSRVRLLFRPTSPPYATNEIPCLKDLTRRWTATERDLPQVIRCRLDPRLRFHVQSPFSDILVPQEFCHRTSQVS